MRTLITALNSKFIHSSLAPWYLKASCGACLGDVSILERTINDTQDSVLADIYRMKPDVAAFSCYIWNIRYVLDIASSLKKILPNLVLVLGGPEVSFDSEKVLQQYGYIDYIISGEGEQAFPGLLGVLNGSGGSIGDVGGLTYRDGGSIKRNSTLGIVEDLNTLASPYTDEMLASTKNRIVYYESSRGCPFSCSYCISSTTKGVRYFSMERVKAELRKLAGYGVKQVKLVDRTFNCNKDRAKEIFAFIIEEFRGINFHFEAAADLFDGEMLQILSKAPPGLIQFEIGMQSTNPAVLELVDRKTSTDKLFDNIKKLVRLGNIHIHLDLIAGLPGEDYLSFRKSFNDLMYLWPDQLQLGFLKLLKGSRLRSEAETHMYRYRDTSPYEVLCSKYMTYDELLELKGIEELVERYYNSGRFANVLRFLTERVYNEPFDFYLDFLKYNTEKGFLDRSLSMKELYTVMSGYLEGIGDKHLKDAAGEFLKLDYLSSDSSGRLPPGLTSGNAPGLKERSFDFLKNTACVERYLPKYAGIPAKQIFKTVHFETFSIDVSHPDLPYRDVTFLFDYGSRNKVTGAYSFVRVDI